MKATASAEGSRFLGLGMEHLAVGASLRIVTLLIRTRLMRSINQATYPCVCAGQLGLRNGCNRKWSWKKEESALGMAGVGGLVHCCAEQAACCLPNEPSVHPPHSDSQCQRLVSS